MNNVLILSVFYIPIFIGNKTTATNPINPVKDNTPSFRTNFKKYSSNNYFTNCIYAGMISRLNSIYEYSCNLITRIITKYKVQHNEVYKKVNQKNKIMIFNKAGRNIPNNEAVILSFNPSSSSRTSTDESVWVKFLAAPPNKKGGQVAA